MPRSGHLERHRTERIGWLRAAVLGENDGIASTASLIVGVAAANAGRGEMLLAGVAGLVAGAMDGRGRVRVRELAGRYRAGRRGTLLTFLVAPASHVVAVVAGTSLVCLTALGAVSARTGR